MKISLIISTYKSPDFLNCVLESIKRQTLMPHQMVITEDGSSSENLALINSWKKRLSFPVVHVTQEDIGNRKPLALNKAILKSTEDYLVFVDGDCVLRNDFLKAHAQFADELSFLTGRRVELSERASKIITAKRVSDGYLDGWPLYLIWDSIYGATDRLGRFFKTPFVLRRLLRQDFVFDIRGCNFSVHKKHLLAINGFSNDFSGAYGEDSDVEIRLKFLGLKMKSVKGAAIQFHLWHQTQSKDESNQERLKKVINSKIPQTANGLKEALNFK